MIMAMLEVKNLGISFGGLRAVDNFEVNIEKGQLYGLIGPNGAGKTTVFNMLTGVYKPDDGLIRLDGQDLIGKSTNGTVEVDGTSTYIGVWGNQTDGTVSIEIE